MRAIHEAIQAHYAERNGDNAVLTDWFVAYGGMRPSEDSPNGIAHVHGYTTSDSSPYGAHSVAVLGVEDLTGDLLGGDEE